jgi:YidC/Oxa1 family membrane protein insertase
MNLTTLLSTEVQRIVLLVGLAATGYLLILAWNADYGPRGTLPETTPAPVVEPASPGDAPGVDRTDEPVVESDVPDPSVVGSAAEAPTSRGAASTVVPPEQRLVHVVTPTLDVWIDRVGGDIVRAQLPQYSVTVDRPDVPFTMLDKDAEHTYIAQSGLTGPQGIDKQQPERPLYRTDRTEYEFEDAPGRVVLETEAGDLHVRKVFEFDPHAYLFEVRYEVENRGSVPAEAAIFAQLKRDSKEPYGSSAYTLGPQPFLGAAISTEDERYQKISFGDLEDSSSLISGDGIISKGGWIAILQHYFVSAWVPNAAEDNRFYGQHRRGSYVVGYTAPIQRIAPGSTGTFETRFYVGPKDQNRLEQIAPNLNLTVDYGFLWWLAVPLFHVLTWLEAVTGNWGVAIILLTFLVKLALYPLSAASYKSMANMRRVTPQMKRLQERHADDRQKLSQEMMALYKKEKVNPLGGCLPILVQMPVFLALYWVLFESVELRHAPFFLWIDDLAAMDRFFVLPILMGGTMYIQQMLNPPMPDPVQARVMKFMPIMFTVLFLFFPAGLVLYWLVNNVLSIAQQWYITRQIEGGTPKAS